VVLYLAIASPSVISSTMINDRDKDVQEIRASTDLREVQQIATMRTQGEVYVMDSARMLLIISAATLVLCMVCSGISLFQIRRLRRQLHEKSPA
jgi:hypothetical protein